MAEHSGPASVEGVEAAAEFEIGQRVLATGNPRRAGTVQYVGAVEGHPGVWVGVDWDDGEGKHDGAVNGVRYFAASGERSASFVRPKGLNAGISLIDALYLRYRGDYTKEEEDEMYVLSTSKKRVAIEFVGKNKVQEKLHNFEELTSVSISYMGVSSIGSAHEIKVLLPNLKELDLTGNFLSKWQDIGSLCEALPSLEAINLTNNIMACDIPKLPSLRNIRVLVLNHCGITWKEVEELKPSLPAVEQLHFMSNDLKTILHEPSLSMSNLVQGFESLRILNLEDNYIGAWDEILRLFRRRSLEQLHLNKNSLKSIYYPVDNSTAELSSDSPGPFQNLQCLLLGSNQIEDLASVDSLNSFPSLTDIRLSENPIADPAKGGLPRFVLVARLAKVKILNGSEVTLRERRESEIRYVRLVMAKTQSENPDEIKRLHPRFTELKALHGMDDEMPSTGTAGPQKMASGLLSVTLRCMGASIGEKSPLKKKLPPTTTVGKLKLLCESLFKLNGIKLRLFIEDEGSPLPQLLDDDMIPLIDIGVGMGMTILVDEEN